jgi:hypothetical protein
MPGLSDSGNPDDIRIHLEEILAADDARAKPPESESESDAELREAVQLRPALRSKLEAVLGEVVEAVPGLSDAEVTKLSATRAARDALRVASRTLARVDNHLRSVTGERNPELGRKYGVYGANPVTFGGVYRALSQCVAENDRVKDLPQEGEGKFKLSRRLARLVGESRDQLRTLLGERFSSRSELSQAVALKGNVVAQARSVISAVRNHLYAELPLRKKDPELRDYGFRPVRSPSRASSEEEDGEESEDGEE